MLISGGIIRLYTLHRLAHQISDVSMQDGQCAIGAKNEIYAAPVGEKNMHFTSQHTENREN